MKIAFFLLSFPTITETSILNLITSLIDLGHTVDIFSLERPHSLVFHVEAENYRLIEKTLYFDRYSGRRAMAKAILSSLRVTLLGLPQIVRYIRLHRKIEELWKLMPFLQKRGYEVLHAHFGQVGAEFITLKDILRLPFITSFYGYDATQIPGENPSIYDKLFERCDFVVVLSNAMKEELLKLKCPAEKIRIQYLGIDIDKFRSDKKMTKTYNTILFVGRLVEKKGVPLAIEAFAKIMERYPETRLKIIGDGYMRERVEKMIQKDGLHDRVILQPFDASQVRIREEMEKADIFVLPSYTSERGDKEGTPMVLMEAQAMGLPVVSSLHAGIPEVVVDGETGFLIKEKDIEALAVRLEYLLSRPELRIEMGRKGRAHIEKNHNLRNTAKSLERLYYEAIALNADDRSRTGRHQ